MFNVILGILLACTAGSLYAFLFWYSQSIQLLKKNIFIHALLFIGRICFLLVCYKLTLKIVQIDAIVFMFGFLTAYTLTVGSLQRKL